MDNDDLVAILEKCIQKDYGDLGRTQYIIKRLKRKQEIFKSDQKYLDMLLRFEQSDIESIEVEQEEKIESKIPPIYDLIKCHTCNNEINFEDKSVRFNNFWHHETCVEKISKKKPTLIAPSIHIQQKEFEPIGIEKIQTRRAIKHESVSGRIIIDRIKPAQIIFTGTILASLTLSVYYLLGVSAAAIVGIIGSSLFFLIYKSQFQTFNKRKKYLGTMQKSILTKTGIPGFENYLVEGLKKNSSIVVSGTPGSGKTTLGLQFLYSGAKDFDEPGVYITLSQNPENIKNDCKSFGWDFDDLINKEKILMIDARPFKIQEEVFGKDDSLYRGEQLPFQNLTKLLSNSIKRIGAKRVVIDSITILAMQYSEKFYMRQGLQGMIQALENYGVTSLIISEFSEKSEIPLEWFVTSGIIQLRHTRKEDTMERTIQITKMRGIKHSEQIHPVVLGKDGLYIFDVE